MNNSPEGRGNSAPQDPRQRHAQEGQMAIRAMATGERARDDRAEDDADFMRLAIGDAPQAAKEKAAPTPKTSVGETSRDRKELEKQAKKNNAIKKYLIGAAAGALTLIAVAGGASMLNRKGNQGPSNPTAIESVVEDDEAAADYEDMETQGIKQGYGEKGMWLSPNKPNDVAFGSAREVREVCGNNPAEMVKYTAENEVEGLSAYIPSLPPQILEKYLPEFSGLTVAEAEKKLESLDAESFDKVMKTFRQIMDSSFAHEDHLSAGEYDNAYMTTIDQDAPINNQNMKLVKCTTYEDGTEVTVFEWFDENGVSIGTMTVKTGDEDGCMQVVVKKGSPVLEDLEEVVTGSEGTGSETTGSEATGSEGTGSENTGSEGTGSEGTGSEGTGSEGTGSEGTGTESTGSESTGSEGTGSEGTNTPKDPAAEIRNAGDHVTQEQLDQTKTPPTDLQQDQANFGNIEQQRQQDAANKAAAEQAAAAQAEKERQAAAEAEKRRQEQAAAEQAAKAQAEQAAKAAAEQAAKEQAARVAAEQQAAAERAAAQKAQDEAQAHAQANSDTSTSHADDTASDRADAFNNGDF